MTNDPRSTSVRHNALIWPGTVLAVVLVGALCAIIVTGHNTDDLVRAIGALFSVAGTVVSTGAWVRSTQAAKQTNGDLDKRIEDGVQKGITLALQQARATPAPAVPGRRGRKPTADDPPTERIAAPKV